MNCCYEGCKKKATGGQGVKGTACKAHGIAYIKAMKEIQEYKVKEPEMYLKDYNKGLKTGMENGIKEIIKDQEKAS